MSQTLGIELREFEWDEPRLVETKRGPRYIRTFTLHTGHPFWDFYKADKEYLRKLGVVVGKDWDDCWQARMWTLTEEWPGDEPYGLPQKQIQSLPQINTEGLLPYQPEHVRRLVSSLRHNDIAVDNSDTGTGKTACSLVACREIGFQPLIVCPKSVKTSWRRWGERLGVKVLDVVNYEMLRTGKLDWVKRTDRKKPGYMAYEWELPPNTCVIFDEAHKLSGLGRQKRRGKKIKEDGSLQAMMGAALKRSLSKYRKGLILSATLAKDPLDMKTTGYLLSLHSYGNFYNWCDNYGVKKLQFGPKFCGTNSDLVNLHRQIFPRFGGGIPISVARDYFPENRILPEVYDLDDGGKLQKVYEEMKDAIRVQKAKEDRDRGWNPMVEMIRAQQQAEILKIPTLTDLAKDSEKDGLSVVVFVNYIETLKELEKRLDCPTIHGQQTETERQQAIDKFQSDEVHFLVCQIQAGGVGISLHQDEDWKRPRTSLFCPTFDARALKQGLGRIHRAGAKDGVVQRVVFGAGSAIEERACRALEKKFAQMHTLNTGEISDEELQLLLDETAQESFS